MPFIHCARGPKICNKCREMSAKEEKYALVRIYLESTEISRPLTKIMLKGQQIWAEYDIIMRFNNLYDAKKYAKENNIQINI